jgi:hypothetical protein
MSIRFAIITGLAAFCASGCVATPVHMRLASELGGVEPMPVHGRQGYAWSSALKFGPWQVATSSAPDSHFRSTSVANPDKEVSEGRNRLAFELDLSSQESSARLSTRVDCQAFGRFAKLTRFDARLTEETEITMPGFPRIDCEFSGGIAGTLASRPVSLTQRDQGTAEFGKSVWQIRSVNQTATQRGNLPLARFGYEGLRDGRVVAAVETTGPGRVWTLPGLTQQQQDEWAAVASALLYYATLLEMQDL